MATVSPVVLKGDAVCGTARKEDIENAAFTVNGAPMPADKAADVRTQLYAAMASMFGKELCTTYVPEAGKLSAKVSVNGEAQADFTQQVIWVKPEDGYRVAP